MLGCGAGVVQFIIFCSPFMFYVVALFSWIFFFLLPYVVSNFCILFDEHYVVCHVIGKVFDIMSESGATSSSSLCANAVKVKKSYELLKMDIKDLKTEVDKMKANLWVVLGFIIVIVFVVGIVIIAIKWLGRCM